MDSALFMEKSNEINHTVESLRRDRQRLLGDDDESLSATTSLIGILEAGPETIQVFDETCFDSIVDKIIAVSQTEVRFRLINGLELTEMLEKIGR